MPHEHQHRMHAGRHARVGDVNALLIVSRRIKFVVGSKVIDRQSEAASCKRIEARRDAAYAAVSAMSSASAGPSSFGCRALTRSAVAVAILAKGVGRIKADGATMTTNHTSSVATRARASDRVTSRLVARSWTLQVISR